MSLNKVTAEMRSIITDWDGILLNPRWIRRETELTWEARSAVWLPTRVTQEALAEAAQSGQYSFQMIDGSLIQMWYRFGTDKATLVSASLGYYRNSPVPDDEAIKSETEPLVMDTEPEVAFSGIDDRADDAEGDQQSIKKDADILTTASHLADDPCPWIRIDYAPSAFRGCIHDKCHMHLSLYNDMRVGVRGVPSPRQFVEAVMAWFYPKEYESRHLDDAGNYTDNERQEWVNSVVLVDSSNDPDRIRLMHFGVVGA